MIDNEEESVVLVSPKFSREERFKLGFSRELLIYGPVQLLHERDLIGALFHILFSILSFGFYWWWIARNSRNNKVISMLNKNWEPKSESDIEALMYNGIVKDKNSSSYIQTSRLGSVDHKL